MGKRGGGEKKKRWGTQKAVLHCIFFSGKNFPKRYVIFSTGSWGERDQSNLWCAPLTHTNVVGCATVSFCARARSCVSVFSALSDFGFWLLLFVCGLLSVLILFFSNLCLWVFVCWCACDCSVCANSNSLNTVKRPQRNLGFGKYINKHLTIANGMIVRFSGSLSCILFHSFF